MRERERENFYLRCSREYKWKTNGGTWGRCVRMQWTRLWGCWKTYCCACMNNTDCVGGLELTSSVGGKELGKRTTWTSYSLCKVGFFFFFFCLTLWRPCYSRAVDSSTQMFSSPWKPRSGWPSNGHSCCVVGLRKRMRKIETEWWSLSLAVQMILVSGPHGQLRRWVNCCSFWSCTSYCSPPLPNFLPVGHHRSGNLPPILPPLIAVAAAATCISSTFQNFVEPCRLDYVALWAESGLQVVSWSFLIFFEIFPTLNAASGSQMVVVPDQPKSFLDYASSLFWLTPFLANIMHAFSLTFGILTSHLLLCCVLLVTPS